MAGQPGTTSRTGIATESFPGTSLSRRSWKETVLAFRPPQPGFGLAHVIVVPKEHIRSLLELDSTVGAELLEVVQRAARLVVDEHGGCQVLTTLGSEQHNRHLHIHIAAGAGVARFVTPPSAQPG
ncbi:HIT domain-containing protein [Streptomyces sp. NPDC002668]|uniref:HIT family protein n=1 Tax=Streptomyces sp. NPDC002668 TaxID=3154422 RepID=UPI00332E84C5